MDDSAILCHLSILNKSGTTQSYAVFAGAPVITPQVTPIYNDFVASFRGVSNGGHAIFTMRLDNLHAICGTRNYDISTDGVQIEVVDHRPIILGKTDHEGRLTAGSTCAISVKDGSPQFDSRQPLPGLGDKDTFCMRTKTDFTFQDAEAGHFMAGYGLAIAAEKTVNVGPFTLFRPSPNTLYQIKPANTFYVAIGDYSPRTPVPVGLPERSHCCRIDFDPIKSDSLTVVHDEKNLLAIQNRDKSRL